MPNRPRIKLKLTVIDKVVEVVGFLVLVFLWILTISGYSDLPEIIPIHFNGVGAVDNYGSRSTIIYLPVIATILFAGLTFLNTIPHLFNYPAKITEANAERQYRLAARLVRFLKMVLVIVFTLIVFQTQQVSSGKSEGLGSWFLPLTLGMTIIPILIYLKKSFKKEK